MASASLPGRSNSNCAPPTRRLTVTGLRARGLSSLAAGSATPSSPCARSTSAALSAARRAASSSRATTSGSSAVRAWPNGPCTHGMRQPAQWGLSHLLRSSVSCRVTAEIRSGRTSQPASSSSESSRARSGARATSILAQRSLRALAASLKCKAPRSPRATPPLCRPERPRCASRSDCASLSSLSPNESLTQPVARRLVSVSAE